MPPSETIDAATSPEAPLIEVVGLSRSYGSLQAVCNLSFTVGRGEVVGFLGPNGAGKSTTLRMLGGYLGPSAGTVRIGGHDVVEEPLLARQLTGYMAETAPLYPEMRVGEYLSFRAHLKGVSRRKRAAHVGDCLGKAEVADVRDRVIGTLSRGYRQRVALADALLGSPPLLILDEPTAGLDPNQIRTVRELIRRLGAEHTVLLSTHILGEVESTCERALVLDRGRLVAEGPIRELTRRQAGDQALLTLFDPARQAFALLSSQPSVLGVAPELTDVAARRAAEAEDRAEGDEVVKLRVTFDAGSDTALHLQELVRALVSAQVGVREVQLVQTTLEEIFRQLTSPEEHSR